MTRLQAFALNLLVFLGLAGGLFALSRWLHPGPLFTANGALTPLGITVGLGAVLGPALMLLIFKPGKQGLEGDVAVLVALQVLVWGYGGWIVWSERPGWLVLAVDRVELVRASEVNADAIPNPLLQRPPAGEPLVVTTRLPENPVTRDAVTFAAFEGSGPDIDRIPHLYRMPAPKDADELRKHSRGNSALPEPAVTMARNNDNVVLLPLVGHQADMLVALNVTNWQIVDWWPVDPWQEESEPTAMAPPPTS